MANNPFLDGVTIGGTTYDLKDPNLTDEVINLKRAISDAGLVTSTDVSFPEQNTFYRTTGESGTHNNGIGTGYVAVEAGEVLLYKLAQVNTLGTICFYTSESINGFISAIVGESSTLEYVEGSVEVPATAKYIRACSWKNIDSCYLRIKKIYNVKDLSDSVNELAADINVLETEVDGYSDAIANKLDKYVEAATPYANQGYLKPNGELTGTTSTSYVTDYIPIEDTVDRIDYNLAKINNSIFLAFYNESKTFISGIEGTGDNKTMNNGSAAIPQGAKWYRAGQWVIAGVTDYYARKVYGIGSIAREIEDNAILNSSQSGQLKTLELSESINKPFDFSNKKITAFGDSITSGVGSPNLQSVTSYAKHFADHVGATLENMAISGQVIAGDGQYSIYNRITNYTRTTDFIIIAGGTNDFNTGVELGTFASTAGTGTFYGALKGICDYLEDEYPTTPVIWITPIPYTNRDPNTPNTAGYTLNQYRQAIYEIGTLYGHSVVNGADLGMPTAQGGWNNAMCDDTDGCHPTAEGHKLYARSLVGKLC